METFFLTKPQSPSDSNDTPSILSQRHSRHKHSKERPCEFQLQRNYRNIPRATCFHSQNQRKGCQISHSQRRNNLRPKPAGIFSRLGPGCLPFETQQRQRHTNPVSSCSRQFQCCRSRRSSSNIVEMPCGSNVHCAEDPKSPKEGAAT